MAGLGARLRKGVLVYVLVLVAAGSWLTARRTTSWESTLWVAVHPIVADGRPVSAAYVAGLRQEDFAPIQSFLGDEARRHGVKLAEPVRVVLGAVVREQPPEPPPGGGALAIMWWSLGLRYWAWRVDRGPSPPPSNVEVYVRYFDPETSPRLAHSLGLQKGLVGVVNAFASRRQRGGNNVIIAHELLHTLGATDKYDPATNQPRFPDGFADPQADPRYPQERAELMAGRIPVSLNASRIPRSLAAVTVGPATAREIRWRD